jgi:hypothetical protein
MYIHIYIYPYIYIHLYTFIYKHQGNLPPYRLALVEFIFQKLDTNHDSEIDEDELVTYFTNSAHPEILSGIHIYMYVYI